MINLPDVPKSLSEKIKKDNIVIFTGAGLSINAGLPSWKDLTISILDGLKERENRADGYIKALENNLFEPIDVLSKIEHHKSYAIEIFEKEIRKFDKVNPTSIHKKISKVSSRIVTTNYDDLVERANSDFERITYYNNYKVSKLSEYEKYIFKIHGDISEPDKCILFPKEYEEHYSHDEKSSVFELKKIFSDKSILFIGFSLTDPYINFILTYVTKLYSGFTPEHYIITTETQKSWPERVTPIILENHLHLETFIDLLTQIKNTTLEDNKNIQKAIEKSDGKITIKYLSELEYDLPPNNKYWVGRKKELENISNENFKVIFITGIGGQGKSALAAHFVKNNFNTDLYEFGDWRDFKEESNRIQTKLISIIKRLTNDQIDEKKLEGIVTNDLIDLFFNYLGKRKIVFIFDNMDSYIDLELFAPIGGLGYLFNQALSRNHNSKFIFTCRPFIREASVNFYQISLSGLSYDESKELFESYKIPVNATQLDIFCRKAHTLTKGHPLWLNLIAAQTIRGIDTANSFIDSLENKTQFNEENFSSILSQKVLTQVWVSLNDNQQTLLRSIAEIVKPETVNNLRSIVESVLNTNRFDKALRNLKNLNLIETKSSSITEDQIELHPLVKEFILTKYPKQERVKFITVVLKYYDNYIYILKQKLNPNLSLSAFQNWTSKIELEINKGDYITALSALEEVCEPILSAGFMEEYLRVSEKLYDFIDWSQAIEQEFPFFHSQFGKLLTTLTHFGKLLKIDNLLDKYEKLIPGKSTYYLLFCSAKCYSYWYQEKFNDSIHFGEKGEFLLSNSGLPDNYSLRHNLALARRDSKDLIKVDQALNYFLGVESLEKVLSFEINENLGSAFYGNIGRCLEFKKEINEALLCYLRSFKILISRDEGDVKLNTGYACYWVSEILFSSNKILEGLYFLKFAILSWEIASPPKTKKLRIKWNNVFCDQETKKQIDSKADWEIEKYCKQQLKEYLTMKHSEYFN